MLSITMKLHRLFFVTVCVCSLAAAVFGQEKPGGTLQKGKDAGVIVIGTREASIPFFYYDENNQGVGYSQDLTNLAVGAGKKKLKLPKLKMKAGSVTPQTRNSF